MKFFLLIVVIIFTQYTYAISEFNYESEFKKTVTPFYNLSPSQYWTNSQNIKIHWKKFIHPNSTKTIVMLPGRTDAVVRNQENIYDLYQKGFSIYMMDEQGQGQSGRLLDDRTKGYVGAFEDYIKEFGDWLEANVLPNTTNQELYFVGHSMGGAIGTLYIHEHPETFKKFAVLAPMYEIQIGSNMRYQLAFRAVRTAVNRGMGYNYIPGTGPFDVNTYQFPGNIYTHSEVRFDHARNVFMDYPEIQLGGATYNWVYESMVAGWSFYRIGSEMRTPALLIQAELDQVVYGGVQKQFCGDHPACKLFVAKGSSHDIFSEQDSIRDEVLTQIENFFQ